MLAAQPRIKSPEAFRTISEVSGDLDVPQHVLRFWEGRFAQIRPVKRAGGRRYYRPEDIDLLRGIRALLYADGYTIKGVQKILRDRGARHVAEIGRGAAMTEVPRVRVVAIDTGKSDTPEPPSSPSVTAMPAHKAIVAQIPDTPTHARAAIALLKRAHAQGSIEPERPGLAPGQRMKLEALLAELLMLKDRLVAARA